VILLKACIVLMLVMVLLLPAVAAASETDRERLVRIETKLDTLIEQSKSQGDRLTIVERRVETHGTWWGVVFAFMGIAAPVIIGVIIKAVSSYMRQPRPKEGTT
jgi:hypothetical protein